MPASYSSDQYGEGSEDPQQRRAAFDDEIVGLPRNFSRLYHPPHP